MTIKLRKMCRVFVSLVLLCVGVWGKVLPIDENDCQFVRHLNNLLEDSDHCIVVFYDREDSHRCPLSFNTTRSIRVTHNLIVNRRAFYYQDKFECKRYLIGTSNISHFDDFFTRRSNYARFLPFTKIILFNSSTAEEVSLTQRQRTYAYFNGLFMISAHLSAEKNINLVNLLTNQTSTSPTNVEDVYHHEHPLFEGLLYPREINISLFHCPPFVIIKTNNETNETIIDGVEYNLINSITEGWRKGITIRYFDDHKVSPWTKIVNDVQDGISNIGLCSPWLNIKHYRVVDLSHSYDLQCLTFLVPRPQIVTPASYIYLPFSGMVWVVYIICLIATAFILHYFVNREFIRATELSSLEVVFLEVINIATSHGATRFPKQVPIKILLVSWTAISLLLSTAYCTGYTSLLTTPRFSKPIDTIADFLEQGITWGTIRKGHSMQDDMMSSGNRAFMEMAKRYYHEKNHTDEVNRIASGKYAKFVKILSNKFITDTETFPNHTHYLRIMKQCISRYYTVLLLKKNSPYTSFVSSLIPRYIEGGFISHWFTEMNTKYGKSYMNALFDDQIKQFADTKGLQMANLLGAFYLLGLGLTVAFVVSLLELRYYQYYMENFYFYH
uniref:Ionotropic glutamate receptor C-terminal domain-containing protein n=1 Tax=Lutzomyia longipalpis TaxID=7200 RepID=A0A3F2ZDC6_LUTLO